MAEWQETAIVLTSINEGQRYEDGNIPNAEAVDAAIEGAAYAQTQANNANSKATQALGTATAASMTANNASNTATYAQTLANQALNTANTAVSTANQALETANEALASTPTFTLLVETSTTTDELNELMVGGFVAYKDEDY